MALKIKFNWVLKWKKEKPSKLGWYWIRPMVDGGAGCVILTKKGFVRGADSTLCYSQIEHIDSKEFEGKEWAGPISEPKE